MHRQTDRQIDRTIIARVILIEYSLIYNEY